jgi:hypothetical protein
MGPEEGTLPVVVRNTLIGQPENAEYAMKNVKKEISEQKGRTEGKSSEFHVNDAAPPTENSLVPRILK